MGGGDHHHTTAIRDDKNAGSFCLRPSSTVAVVAQDSDEHLIDYYTPDGVEIVPRFGERRSPSCVDDWLELNHLHNVQTTNHKQICIKTKCLQREISFPAVKPMVTVPTMIQSFSSPSIRPNSKESALPSSRFIKTSQNCLELENLRKASSVSKLLATTFKGETTQKANTPSKHNQTVILKRINKRRAPRPDQIVHQRCT